MATPNLLDSRYQVLRTIGSGGMGVVYLVFDTRRENKIMALKTLKSGKDSDAAELFRSEFRNIRGVRHPHIPEVYDFGTLPGDEGTLYFTCEFIDGKPLDALAKQWSPDQLKYILVSLCRALAFLHSRSLLHRDIKPENVLGKLAEDENFSLLKLVDFGLAQMPTIESGDTAGTLDYMAPEILQGGNATVATDLYAVGLLLYRLATGRLPFEGEDAVALVRTRTTTEASPPLRFRPDLPVGLADVISSLIRLKPEDRPQSARHAIALLNEREGTEFAYETAETSRAYTQSSATTLHADARRLLLELKPKLQRRESVRGIVLESEPGLGRTRLLQEFVSELTMSGIATQMIRHDRDLPLDAGIRVVVIPDVLEISEKERKTLTNEPADVVWVLGGREMPEEIAALAASCERLRLSPLQERDVKDFVNATFPENNFADGFAKTLIEMTMGFPSAIQSIFDKLQEKEILRIGLNGWELLPVSWSLPVHRHVSQMILRRYEGLSVECKQAIHALACTSAPLPESVLDSYLKQAIGRTVLHSVRGELEATGWTQVEFGEWSLRYSAVSQTISEMLTDKQKTKVYRELRDAWRLSTDTDATLREREILYNDVKGKTWATPVSKSEFILAKAFQQGHREWIRQLLEWCLENSPPEHFRKIALTQLSQVEYQEGNLAESSNYLGDVLDGGEIDIDSKTLPLLARYALLEEKLGRTENSEAILERCLRHLGEEHTEQAGTIYGTLAWITFKKGDQDRARELAEEGLVRVPPTSLDAGYAQLLNTVATLGYYRGMVDVAEAYWQRCLEVQENLGDQKGIANMYNNLGVLAAQSGDRLRARSLWEKCADISKRISDSHRLAGIYNNLGIDSLETGAMREAEDYYLKSLSLFRRMKSPREQVEALSNLGELAYYRADYPRAMAYFNEAIDLSDQLGDQESQIEPMVYLGKLLVTLEQLETAEPLLRKAQSLASEMGVKKGEGQAWEGLAMIHSRRSERDLETQALSNANRFLSGDVDLLATVHLHLTECALASERADKSEIDNSLKRAREVAEIKWDPFTAARTQVYGLLFADEELDSQQRLLALRKISVYPDLQWRYHWAMARQYAKEGQVKRALDEFGRGVGVLKAITARLSEDYRNLFLSTSQIAQFKAEAVQLRKKTENA